MSTETTVDTATVGDTVLVKARPNYKALIEYDGWGRLTVKPLPGQGVTERRRAIWRKALLRVENQHEQS